ncbi:hypothetical protein [Paraburkholderia sediminicola]|uniref:hypothetical protein n=1 Tax=Paraburkholderia sediminicola TaxID=458836 RepID=UPI0038BBE7A0
MRALAAIVLVLWATAACADWRGDVQSATLVGEGDFSVFGFKLYRAPTLRKQLLGMTQ